MIAVDHAAGAPARGSAERACGPALLGDAVMAGALGAGNARGEALARTVGAEGDLRQLPPAVPGSRGPGPGRVSGAARLRAIPDDETWQIFAVMCVSSEFGARP